MVPCFFALKPLNTEAGFLWLLDLKYPSRVLCMYVCMYVCMDGWMDGWMDGCMYVCM